MTDIHYLAESLTDRGNMFQSMVEHGDGKLTNYVWEITDAALEEIKLLSPDALIISGDLSLQGEKKSHEELAKKLDEVEKAGITVLVIPGNHDINNPSASVYSGGDRYPAEPTAPEDFERIYKNSDTRRPAAGMPIPSVTPMTWDRLCACSCWIPASMNPATR